MRVAYTPPSVTQYTALFSKGHTLKGGGLGDIQTYHSPIYHQRGSGIISFISRLLRRGLPFLRRVIAPVAGDMAQGIASDISNNRNMRQSVRERGIAAMKDIGRRTLSGGRKRKHGRKQKKKKPVRGKCISRNVFI
jgi:hypothetical protein